MGEDQGELQQVKGKSKDDANEISRLWKSSSPCSVSLEVRRACMKLFPLVDGPRRDRDGQDVSLATSLLKTTFDFILGLIITSCHPQQTPPC